MGRGMREADQDVSAVHALRDKLLAPCLRILPPAATHSLRPRSDANPPQSDTKKGGKVQVPRDGRARFSN